MIIKIQDPIEIIINLIEHYKMYDEIKEEYKEFFKEKQNLKILTVKDIEEFSKKIALECKVLKLNNEKTKMIEEQLCEYLKNNYKLAEQFDLMENNPQLSMCFNNKEKESSEKFLSKNYLNLARISIHNVENN